MTERPWQTDELDSKAQPINQDQDWSPKGDKDAKTAANATFEDDYDSAERSIASKDENHEDTHEVKNSIGAYVLHHIFKWNHYSCITITMWYKYYDIQIFVFTTMKSSQMMCRRYTVCKLHVTKDDTAEQINSNYWPRIPRWTCADLLNRQRGYSDGDGNSGSRSTRGYGRRKRGLKKRRR